MARTAKLADSVHGCRDSSPYAIILAMFLVLLPQSATKFLGQMLKRRQYEPLPVAELPTCKKGYGRFHTRFIFH